MGSRDIALRLGEVALGLLVVWVAHAKIGRYPEPLPMSESRKRDIGEVLVLWFILFLFGFLMAFVYLPYIDYLGPNFTKRTLYGVYVRFIPEFFLPLALVLPAKGWNLKRIGFRLKVESKQAAIFAVVYGLVIGSMKAFRFGSSMPPKPMPAGFLIAMLLQTAFLEDFTYRAVIQGKLETAIGQLPAILMGGVLFGLSHLAANLHSMGRHFDFWELLFTLFGQMTIGWLLGIIYMKTRSLWPQVICHFSLNWMAVILVGLPFFGS